VTIVCKGAERRPRGARGRRNENVNMFALQMGPIHSSIHKFQLLKNVVK
jgi:hypothetical protein